MANIGVVALPYDRDSVLKVLAAGAKHARPDTTALDSLYASFRGPFSAFSMSAYEVGVLKDSASRYPSDSPEAPRFAKLIRDAEARRDAAHKALDLARRPFDARVPALRQAIHAWEDTTFAEYGTVTRRLVEHADPVSDTTDAQGWAHITPTPAHWWLYVRAFDTNDPNAEWYWNLPVTGDTVILSRANARHGARY